MNFLKDTNGKISAKRIFGGLCIIAGIVLLFIQPDTNPTNLITVFSAGGALLGISVAEKKAV